MKRPKVSVENIDAVYDYYQGRTPQRLNNAFLHHLFGTIFHPQVEYAPTAYQKIDDHLQNAGQILLVANHEYGVDPLILASIAQREKVLRPLRNNTVILGKAPVFQVGIIRPFLDNFVALPTYRPKDFDIADLPEEEAQLLRTHATARVVKLAIDHANEGRNIAIYPHGTRRSSSGVRSGVGQIACGIERPENFLIMPVGTHYPNPKFPFAPNVFVGVPYEVPATPDDVTRRVEASIEGCVDTASHL